MSDRWIFQERAFPIGRDALPLLKRRQRIRQAPWSAAAAIGGTLLGLGFMYLLIVVMFVIGG